MNSKQVARFKAISLGLRGFYRLLRVLKDLKVIPKDQGYNLSNVHKYSERVLNIIEDKK